MKLGTLAAAASLCCALTACHVTPAPTKQTSDWWSHVSVLASDRLQGRLTGSDGYREATRYVADRFAAIGLEPAGADGYFQPVRYDVQEIDSERSSLTLTGDDGVNRPFRLGDDLLLSGNAAQLAEVTAPLVFVGYGLHLPEIGYDDFADVDLTGKIAVFMGGAPAGISGPMQAYGRAEALPAILEAKGAVGVLVIPSTKATDPSWDHLKAAATQPGMYLAEPDLRRFRSPGLIGSINPQSAALLFANAPQPYESLALLHEHHAPLPHFALPSTLSARLTINDMQISADNVVAELPGSDPSLASQAVLVTAHLDHLGTGKPDHGDGIFHGAMDNAAGVASMIEIARAFSHAETRPKRSILFVALSGEEKGLLGSRYFAAHPTRHVGALVADFNIDMFLPLFPLRQLVAFGGEESSLGADAVAVGKKRSVRILADSAPDQLIFIRSDQYSFIRRGVPSLMLSFAAGANEDEAAQQSAWLKNRYHAQSDDLNQPIDLVAADDFDHFMVALVGRVADQEQPPYWNGSSFFRRFAQTPLQ